MQVAPRIRPWLVTILNVTVRQWAEVQKHRQRGSKWELYRREVRIRSTPNELWFLNRFCLGSNNSQRWIILSGLILLCDLPVAQESDSGRTWIFSGGGTWSRNAGVVPTNHNVPLTNSGSNPYWTYNSLRVPSVQIQPFKTVYIIKDYSWSKPHTCFLARCRISPNSSRNFFSLLASFVWNIFTPLHKKYSH